MLIFCTAFSVKANGNKSVCFSPTPQNVSYMKYRIKLGSGYRSSPSPPVIYKNYLFTVANGTLYKINKTDGSTAGSVKLQSRNFYSLAAPVAADNKIFVQLDGGIIQAVDADTLAPLWTYTAPLGGQALCPILYDNGFIYTGFWNGETEKASFICLDASDTDNIKTAHWTYISDGGFYFVRAVIKEDFIIFGSDNGSDEAAAKGKIIALNKENGKTASSLSVTGDIRSGIFYDSETDCFYTVSKGGYLYKFSLDENSGTLNMLSEKSLPGEATSTPAVYNKRLYSVYSKDGKGEFAVFDAESMNVIYTCEMKGYCQGDILVNNYYEQENGFVYIYASYNTPPGGITLFKDKNNQTTPIKTELFTPPEEFSQYSVSPVICDNGGTLYYKNDSGCIFAVEEEFNTLPLYSMLSDFFNKILTLMKKIINFCKTGALI